MLKTPGIIKFPIPPYTGATAPVFVSVVVTRFKGDFTLLTMVSGTFCPSRLLKRKLFIEPIIFAGGVICLSRV